MTVWLNGALAGAEARIDPADRGFTLGDGVFETIRVQGGVPRHLGRHLERLRAGTERLGFRVGYDDAALADGMLALLAAEGLTDAALRLTVTRGPAPRGLLPPAHPTPTVLMGAAPLPALPAELRAVIAAVTRRNEHSPLARIKALGYLDNILARQEAAERGADDAILLNTAGRVAETTIANLFVRLGDTVATPPVEEGALPGIARGRVLAALGVAERPLAAADLAAADEIVLTNSLGLRAVVVLDGETVGAGAAGPLYGALTKVFEE
ncbi:MAG: aminotransferase class IV [Magnetospirillum sp.]|nr:aminotransferase class IV [Magnetospirillum sp.]